MIATKKKQLSLPKLMAKTQRCFNQFIRQRDADKPCITCGKYLIQHACHFYAVGFYSALRFVEDNCHGGCLQCNFFKHGAGNEYRRNIEKRIGRDRLLLLDAAATRHRFKKYSKGELEIIYTEYKKKNILV